jgi:hypothetical protein
MLTRIATVVRQFICGLHGHDALLHFAPGRLSLQCVSCGYESEGWDLKGAHPHQDVSTEKRVIRLPLTGARRVV